MRGLGTIQSQKYLMKKDRGEQEYQELSEKVSGETGNKIRAKGERLEESRFQVKKKKKRFLAIREIINGRKVLLWEVTISLSPEKFK